MPKGNKRRSHQILPYPGLDTSRDVEPSIGPTIEDASYADGPGAVVVHGPVLRISLFVFYYLHHGV